MSDTDSTLRDLFASARKKQEDISQLDPRSDTYKKLQDETIKAFIECRSQLSRLSIFSANEEIDDIATQDVQYLAVDYFLAELLLKSYEGQRQQLLRQALELFDGFLDRLEHYGLLSAEDKQLYEQFQESKTSFSLAATTNVEERRRVKVARFQQEKGLKTKLEVLRNKANGLAVDDETTRSLYLAEIALFSTQTFHSLDMVTREVAILAQARFFDADRPNEPDGRQERRGLSADGYSERLDGPNTRPGLGGQGPLLSKSGKPLQPFTLTEKRTQLRDGVFRPSHNLPTMSIDEYLEEEKRRGGILDSDSGANGQTVEFDEDNHAHADAATMKAREWDEFTEANPKGAGNTLNRG